ncbi:MAG: aldo/keto reductase [Myxococcota bacterium]
MITGRATPEGTRRLFEDLEADPGWSRPFGRTGLTVSAVGFGCYRITEGEPDHRRALREALLHGGCNVIDTSTNYGFGASERLVGEVVAEAVEEGLDRAGLVVVTKVGYWQGAMLDDLRREEAQRGGLPYRVARMRADHWHSVDPALIGRALDVSRTRTGLETPDVVLLHNPEHLLDPGPLSPDAFYDHLAEAFAALEDRVRQGAIGAYGVSSNSLVAPPGAPGATSLARILEAARRGAGPDHHMQVVQVPLNPLERGAETLWGDAPSVLDRASDEGLAVLTNRPLNGLHRGRLVRLADPGPAEEAGDFAEARRLLAALESACPERVRAPRWSRELPRAMRELGSVLDFDDFVLRYADPRTAAAVEEGAELDPGWCERYRQGCDRLMRAARAQFLARDRAHLQAVFEEIAPELPPGLEDAPWSRRAVAWSATRHGVSSVLVGMRRPAYVEDVTALRHVRLSRAGGSA